MTRSITLRLQHADGTWRVLELLVKNALAEPAVRGIVANARDVTEQEEARRREAEQEEQLLQSAKLASLGTLVSGIAHEVNNPNNFIRLNAGNLRTLWEDIEGTLDGVDRESPLTLKGIPYGDARKMVREMISGVLAGSYRIERLVGGLRDYSRRRESQRVEPMDVNRAVESALTMVATVVKQSTSRFTFEPADALPPVAGDPHQIEQVVINLVSNACQSLPRRDAAVTVSTRFDAAAGHVILSVTDEGVGIAPGDLERLTEPFYTTRRERGGLGLGLSICDRIARNHGGRLQIVSAPGIGTCATIALPACGRAPP
jgi:polar amino acid transport system substrate-binding protein